jgi:hypothetical protein
VTMVGRVPCPEKKEEPSQADSEVCPLEGQHPVIETGTMTTTKSDSTSYQIEHLIVTAFRTARDRGKPDWRRMTIAVLKNRLLQLSHGVFHERNHGALSFREFLSSYSHILRIEDDNVELIEPEMTEGIMADTDAMHRIRPDLWQAVVDFSSGKKYAWDVSQERAREARPEDTLLLPTLRREEMTGWRDKFVSTHGSKPALQRWRDESLGTKALPSELQGKWNGFVREKVVDRLRHWFSSHGLSAPTLVQGMKNKTEHETSTEQLRSTIAACVAVMTEEELAEIRLPPAAVLRARLTGRLP